MMKPWKLVASTMLVAATIGAAVPARAIGSDDTDVKTCPKGKGWDRKAKACVVKESKLVPDADRTDYAYALAKEGRYQEALEILDTLKNGDTAEALNYRGYATR